MKLTTRITVLVTLGVLMTGVAMAQFAKPDDAIKYRKSVMTLIVTHFKRMGAMVQGKASYDPKTFTANAEVVKMMGTLPWESMLSPGSDKGDTTKSSAVFKKKDDFMKMARAFETATAELAAASQSGNLDAAKSPFNTVAQSCKACHKPFRK